MNSFDAVVRRLGVLTALGVSLSGTIARADGIRCFGRDYLSVYEPLSGDVMGISVRGDLACVVTTYSGANFEVVDVSNPAAPARVGALNLSGRLTGVAIVRASRSS